MKTLKVRTTVVILFVSLALQLRCARESHAGGALRMISISQKSAQGNWFFRAPTRMVSLPDGRVAVIDAGHHRVIILDRQGRFLKVIGSFGLNPSQFYYPSDVTAIIIGGKNQVNEGKSRVILAVIDRSYRLQYFDVDKGYLDKVKLPTVPRLIGSDHTGKMWIIDEQGKMLNLNYGSVTPQFQDNFPLLSDAGDLVIDESQNRLIVVQSSGAVNFYSFSGKLQHSVIAKGIGAGRFLIPSGVTLLADRSLLIVDMLSSYVHHFSSSGQFLQAYRLQGKGELQMINPIFITSDRANNITICDKYHNRILHYQFVETIP